MSRNWSNGLESEPVTTYIDSDVKKSWEEHAEEMGVSLSRFIELMVNAGRKQYSDTTSLEQRDEVSMEREIKVLRDRLESIDTIDRDRSIEIYEAIDEEYRELEQISSDTDIDEKEVYESLQELISADLVEYSHLENAYRRK